MRIHWILWVSLSLFGTSIGSAQNNRTDWNKPFPPHKIISNIYYVGAEEHASFLIATRVPPSKPIDDVQVVDDLVINIQWGAKQLQGPFEALDRRDRA